MVVDTWEFTDLRGSNGIVSVVAFKVTFTDPAMPGVQDIAAGVVGINPAAGITASSTNEDIASAVKDSLGPRWLDMVSFHTRQLEFLHMKKTTESYTPPVELTPEQVRATLPPLSASQLRLGLIQGGFTLAQVEAAIDAIPDPTDRETARIRWEYASRYERLHPLIASVGAALGLTDEDIDTMWNAAIAL